jgi:hypothetical protein
LAVAVVAAAEDLAASAGAASAVAVLGETGEEQGLGSREQKNLRFSAEQWNVVDGVSLAGGRRREKAI